MDIEEKAKADLEAAQESSSFDVGPTPVDDQKAKLAEKLTHTGTVEIHLIAPVHKNFGTYIYLFFKRLFDFLFALLLIVILSPVLLGLAIAVKCGCKGSIIYKHKRLGYRGKVISVLKFRSMNQDDRPLEEVLTPEQLKQYKTEFKIDDDPRVTKVGKLIRKTSLDELPQLFNVLIGNMSFVGPRPIVYKELKTYYHRSYEQLLSVKPGITGYWQAYGRNDISYASGKRQAMEIYYVHNRSIWLDIKILFKTVVAVFSEKGAK
jgi:lipopolysaccharide/colanic/teichoic acid biosynthesis glycosyltransferase